MLSVTACVADDLRAKQIQMFGVRHSGYCIFVEGFNGSLLKFRSRSSMVLAIALDHLAVGVEFEALVTRLAYPGSHAVSIDPLVDRVSELWRTVLLVQRGLSVVRHPMPQARELFLALISSDRPTICIIFTTTSGPESFKPDNARVSSTLPAFLPWPSTRIPNRMDPPL